MVAWRLKRGVRCLAEALLSLTWSRDLRRCEVTCTVVPNRPTSPNWA